MSSLLRPKKVAEHAPTYLYVERTRSDRELRPRAGELRKVLTESGALPPRPARKRNAISWPSFCAKEQPKFHAVIDVRE